MEIVLKKYIQCIQSNKNHKGRIHKKKPHPTGRTAHAKTHHDLSDVKYEDYIAQ